MNEASQSDKSGRTFLVVVDDTEEMRAALRYACRRARHTGGRVALLRVIPPAEYHQFAKIAKLMAIEAREDAERLLKRMADEVHANSGEFPAIYVRQGEPREQVLALIDEEPSFSILVLAAGTGPQGPGPLVDALTGRYVNRLRIPITIVPGTLSDQTIDSLA
jgi:nucleotide-binding universal stress UspA family protein